MGATSLTFVALHRRIAERLGDGLSLQAMFETPTVESLARALAASRERGVRAEAFVTFGSRVEAPTLFMLPGVLGFPLYLRGLAEALDPDVRLASLQLPGLFDAATPIDTVEAQAEFALAHLRRAQPAGPYYIGGHSYGGCVAIEVARRLRAAGESVPLLVLGDTVRTSTTLDAFQTDAIAQLALARALEALYGPGAAPQLPLERLAAMFKANFRALGRYRPEPIAGDMVVVRTEGGFPPEFLDYESGDALADPALGWTGFAQGRLEVRTMPGDHLSMQQASNIRAFAEVLRDLVLSAESRPRARENAPEGSPLVQPGD
jgi:thioesterase domain-containing protein